MNILYDYQTFALQARGGISRYFYELICRIAADHMCSVSLFMGLHINEYGLQRVRARYRSFFGVKVPEVPHTLGLRLKVNELLFSRYAGREDGGVYHQTYFYNPLQTWKGKRVVTVYDMIYELHPENYRADDPTAKNKAAAVRQADAVICISENTRQDVMRILNVPREKTSVVYLANSLREDARGTSLVDQPYLLYVGKRGGYKNFDRLLQAYAQTAALRNNFKLISFGGGEFATDEMARIRLLGVADRVEVCSGTDRTLASLYAHATALVYPSLSEGFGIPPLEAMQYDCPVIVSNTSSIPEVVGNAGAFFDPKSVEDIAMQIESVLSDENLRRDLVARGRQRVKEFSWERCANETRLIYERLQ